MIPTIALEHGGPSHAVRVMAGAVARLGVDVEVFATSDGTPQGKEDPTRIWEYTEDDVRYRLFPYFARLPAHASWSLTHHLFARTKTYDVLHLHAPFSYPMLAACTSAARSMVPYIYRPLGTLDPWSLRHKAWKKWPYYYAFESRNLKRAALVHVTSRPEYEAIRALGIPHEKLVLIPHGVPPVSASAVAPPAPPLRVLFIGRLHPKKGIPHLIDAIAHLRRLAVDIQLVIAGTGDVRYVESLVAQVRTLNLGQSIRFVGFASGAMKAQLFANSHVMALPAYDENFGISVAEAMAAGLPVVISDAVGIADAVRSARAGRVCAPGDALAVAQALFELVPTEERRCCGARAAALVAAEYSIPVMAARLVKQYVRVTEAGVLA